MCSEPYQFSADERMTYEKSPFPLLIYQLVDGQYKVVLISDSYCQMVDSKRQSMLEYLNHHSFNRVHPADVSRLAAYSSKIALTDQPSHLYYRLSIDGSYHDLLAYAKRQQMPNGSSLVFVNYLDLTDQEHTDKTESKSSQASYDQVSDLPDANYFNRFADAFLENALAANDYADFLYIDVKSLRSYNEHFGILKGNLLLRAIGRSLRQHFPNAFTVRYVDDTFVTIAQPFPLTELLEIQQEIANLADDKTTTIRFGIYHCKETERATSCTDKACLALRYGDRIHSQTYYVYDRETRKYFASRDYIQGHFEEALAKGWLGVCYQPIFNTFSGKICAFEAVSRWTTEDGQVRKAADFVPTLKQAGLIYQLDLHVLKHVCALLRKRRANNLASEPVSINLSHTDFRVPGFLDKLVAIIKHNQIPFNQLRFDFKAPENSEHLLELQKAVTDLRQLGFDVCLDKYGGKESYISIDSLMEYEFSAIKVDLRSFASTHDRAKVILASTVAMSKYLKLRPIVEGIEDQETYNFVHSLGVMYAQGHYLAEEIPEKDLVDRNLDLPAEGVEEHELYLGISNVNVLNPSLTFSKREAINFESPDPISIFTVQNGELTFNYLNSHTRDWIKEIGLKDAKDLARFFNGSHDANVNRMWDAVRKCQQVDDYANFEFVKDDIHYQIKLQMVAKANGMRAYLSDGKKVKDTVMKPDELMLDANAPLTNEDLFRAAMTTSNVALSWKDAKPNFIGANQRFLDYLCLSQKELLAMNAHPDNCDYSDVFGQKEHQLLKDGQSVDDYTEINVRGSKRQVHYFMSPIYVKNQIAGILGGMFDVTVPYSELMTIKQEVTRDDLTALKNRRGFEHDFGQLVGQKIFTMMIDVDFFKEFNDDYGHRYGDEVLKKLALSMMQVYGIKNCYRYGGDEFLVMGSFTSTADIVQKDHKLRQLLSQIDILDLSFDVHISAGYAHGVPEASREVSEFIRQADASLYQSKSKGRNQLSGSVYQKPRSRRLED